MSSEGIRDLFRDDTDQRDRALPASAPDASSVEAKMAALERRARGESGDEPEPGDVDARRPTPEARGAGNGDERAALWSSERHCGQSSTP
ncbi:hypothetical protein [Frankia sp. AgB32]|uniref:hypothetical protein n=1 Tax=Frankia sp. AgB32 TaxID=631119 RepID=UPI00200D42BC|nr:hypothetical protein [Frankia sp. AgB32]MCK9896459.1 hypothetical protein [Frankia sp. AgB32]